MAAKPSSYTTEIDALCCPICLEQYRDPRTLTCAHTFCQMCIHQHVLKQIEGGHLKDGIECPLCRKVAPKSASEIQPKEWSNSLPINYALQEVIESRNKEVELCKICQSKDIHTVATKYCIQCRKKLCNDCVTIHNVFEQFQYHRILGVDNATNLIIPDELDHCTVHGKPIEFYCIDEKKPCCSSCAIIQHRKCNEVAEISDIAEQQNAEKVITMCTKMRELKLKVNNVDYFYEKEEKEIDRQITQMDEKMLKEQDRVINILKESRAKIMAEANSVRQKATAKYEIYRSQCKELTSSLQSSFQSVDAAQQYGTPVQLFIALHKQELQLADIGTKGDTLFNNLKRLDISTENTASMIFSQFQSYKGKHYELKSQERKVVVNEISAHTLMEIEKVRSVDLNATNENEKKPLYSGIEFLHDGRLIAVDCKNRKCIIISEELTTLGTHSLEKLLLDVICISPQNILVSAGLELLSFGVRDDNVLKQTETINIKQNADSLSVYNDETFVIGTYGGRKPAALIHKNGDEKDFGINFPDKEWKIDDSFCTFDRETDKLAVTDMSENKVYIYDTNTKSEKIVQDERIKQPRGVTVGPESCFFVCSKATGTVVQISQSGDILLSLKVDMTNPYILCFSKDNKKLAVTNNAEERMLQLYNVLQ